MQKNIQSDSHVLQKLACNILDAVDDGFTRYQDEIQKRDMDVANKEYECHWII